MNASVGIRTDSAGRAQPAAFAALALLALAVCAVGLYAGRAPILSPYPEDWIGWARTTLTWSGVFAVGVVLLAVGAIGAARSLLPVRRPAARRAVTEPEAETMAEPAAETAPIATLRCAGNTTREVTAMVMLEAVQDSARPTQKPAPTMNISADVVNIMITSPAA